MRASALAFLVGFALAFLLPGSWLFAPPAAATAAADAAGRRFACPMFCVLREEPGDGRCPICGMELAPIDDTPRLSRTARERIGLAVRPIERVPLVRDLELLGVVVPDENGLFALSARAHGWIVSLAARETGVEVEAGEVLAELDSPELILAQEEFLAARDLDPGARDAARARLVELGVAPPDVERILTRGSPLRAVPLRAPAAGVIARRGVTLGAHVRAGDELFALRDLSRVWIDLLAFPAEADLLAVGTPVAVASSGDAPLVGAVSFVDPEVDPLRRTRRVRVELENRRRRDGSWSLVPGMRVHARARVRLGQAGRPRLGASAPRPCLALPRSAVLETGRRAGVYVLHAIGSDGAPRLDLDPEALPGDLRYRLVEVEVGPPARRADAEGDADLVPLLAVRPAPAGEAPLALREGVLVATSGALLLDSQEELAGRRSLLAPRPREARRP